MTFRCLECGAIMDKSYKGVITDFWRCPNCKREIGVQHARKNDEDEFI